MSSTYTRGQLEVIAGPMFAGKSSKLLQQILFLEFTGSNVLVLKPTVDDRYDADSIVTHNNLKHPAVAVIDLQLVKDNYTIKPYNFHTIFIDEIQFFDSTDALMFVEEGLAQGVNFVVTGLDQDSTGKPFVTTALMLALADKANKVTSFCSVCGKTAHKSHRLRATGGRIKVGGADTYEPRCHEHWESN